MKQTLLAIFLDFGLLLIAFALVHTINYGHVRFSPTNWDVFQLQAVVVLGLSLLVGKYRRVLSMDLRRAAVMVLKVVFFCLLLLSLIIVGMHWMHFSRAMIYGTVLVLAVLELAVLAIFRRRATPHAVQAQVAATGDAGSERAVHPPLMVIDAMLLAASVALAIFLKRGRFSLEAPYDHILLITAGLWWVSAMVTHKFDKNNFSDLFTAIGPALRSAALMAAGLALLIYFFRLEAISRFQAFAPLLFLLTMEFVVFGLYVNYREGGRPNGDISDPARVREMIAAQSRRRPLAPGKPCPVTDPVTEKLQNALDFFDPRIFAMLSAKVPLDTINRCDCALLSTDDMFNLDVLDDGRMRMIINLHKLNDIRWFNRYFLMAHDKLAPGGYLMGKAHTIATHRAYFREKYPKYLGTLFHAASFLWGRVFPKLPWLQKLYFAPSPGGAAAWCRGPRSWAGSAFAGSGSWTRASSATASTSSPKRPMRPATTRASHLRPAGAPAPQRPGRPARHGVQVSHHVSVLRVSPGVHLRPQRPGRRRQVQGRFPGHRLGRLHAAHLARRAAHALQLAPGRPATGGSAALEQPVPATLR
jgi:hypothetical protein